MSKFNPYQPSTQMGLEDRSQTRTRSLRRFAITWFCVGAALTLSYHATFFGVSYLVWSVFAGSVGFPSPVAALLDVSLAACIYGTACAAIAVVIRVGISLVVMGSAKETVA